MKEDIMLWLAVLLVVVGVASFVVGFVLVTNGTAVAPRRRTEDDPTGVKRAASRVAWPDVFRRMPTSFAVTLDENANRSDRLAAVGSLCVLIAALAWCIAVLAVITAFV
ncbi:hypothetical protein MGAST_17430 [Mycobacterium gastri 'Wayne']|uniref:Uncharacterized protein n=2 Tax=Mycobacterium gastri TaxID=1777 RepID=A0A1X1VIC9_MYCGS|nr:hypothetical protein MGAST_17430 [Mycobacterium gastri 'Wayne']ORV68739.1 hypothetical protein AWC07_07555 [Mycobacterium gastri]